MGTATRLEHISVSSINDFMDCRLRWCYKWIANRVPRTTPQALVVGKAVHKAFENAFAIGTSVGDELDKIIAPFGAPDAILDEKDLKVYEELAGLAEPLRQWKDNFPVERVLEVEEPFSFFLTSGAKFRGRPDRVAVVFGKVLHIQNKTIGANIDAGKYITLAQRNLHELIYGWYLAKKYEKYGMEYGGTIYNIVRKLKHRELLPKAKADKLVALGQLRADYTNADRRRLGDVLNPIESMFFQTVIAIDPVQQQQALEDLNQLSVEMDRVADSFLHGGNIPANRARDGGWGKAIDPYTAVMMHQASLDDPALFMDREETYEEAEAE